MVRKIIIVSTQILYYIMYCYYSLCEFIYKKEQKKKKKYWLTNTETMTTTDYYCPMVPQIKVI